MSSATYPRGHLQVDRLYHESPTGRFFYTVDGVGVHWFEDHAEAMREVGDFGRPMITIMSRLAD